MRVVILVHGFPPAAQGGTELYADAQACRLATHHGDHVLVIAREADPSRPEYATRVQQREHFDVAFVNHTFRDAAAFRDTYVNARVDAAVLATVDVFEPDVVHVHHLTCLSTTVVERLAARGTPCVMTLHDYWLICHRGQLFDLDLRPCPGLDAGCTRCLDVAGGAGLTAFAASRLLRAVERRVGTRAARTLRQASQRVAAWAARSSVAEAEARARVAHMRRVCDDVALFFAPSRYMRDRFVQFGVASSRIVVAPCGIDVGPLTRVVRQPSARLRVGFVGSLMVSKGVDVLLRAHARLPAGAAEVHVFGEFAPYHGDRSYAGQLQPLLAQPHVTHHGALPHERIAEAFATIDVLVVPSVWPETAGLVIREAFAAGVAVVASRTGGIPELVDDEVNGLLVEPGDVDDLERAMRRLLDEPDLLARLRAAAPHVPLLSDDVAFTRGHYERLVRRPS